MSLKNNLGKYQNNVFYIYMDFTCDCELILYNNNKFGFKVILNS